METAVARRLSDGSVRIVPVRLDDTELPALLQSLKWLWADPVDRVVREITGLASDADYIMAVQRTIAAAGLNFRYFDGFGVAVGCPNCGAPSSELEPWGAADYERDDEYAGARCLRCGWEDGGEVGW
jgi:hypothetical protein